MFTRTHYYKSDIHAYPPEPAEYVAALDQYKKSGKFISRSINLISSTEFNVIWNWDTKASWLEWVTTPEHLARQEQVKDLPTYYKATVVET